MNLKFFFPKILIGIFLFVIPIYAYSANYESYNHIQEVVENFLKANISTNPDEMLNVNVLPISRQLKLAACGNELSVNFPNDNAQSNTVEVKCNDIQAWHIYVPVDVQVFTKVVVSKNTIAPGHTITADDVTLAPQDKNKLYDGYYASTDEVMGQVVEHLMTPNTVLTKKNIHPPLLIHRNQTVTIISKNSNIMVSMQGIAKTDGYLNAPIKVFNPSSNKTLDAIVTGPNQAEISF